MAGDFDGDEIMLPGGVSTGRVSTGGVSTGGVSTGGVSTVSATEVAFLDDPWKALAEHPREVMTVVLLDAINRSRLVKDLSRTGLCLPPGPSRCAREVVRAIQQLRLDTGYGGAAAHLGRDVFLSILAETPEVRGGRACDCRVLQVLANLMQDATTFWDNARVVEDFLTAASAYRGCSPGDGFVQLAPHTQMVQPVLSAFSPTLFPTRQSVIRARSTAYTREVLRVWNADLDRYPVVHPWFSFRAEDLTTVLYIKKDDRVFWDAEDEFAFMQRFSPEFPHTPVRFFDNLRPGPAVLTPLGGTQRSWGSRIWSWPSPVCVDGYHNHASGYPIEVAMIGFQAYRLRAAHEIKTALGDSQLNVTAARCAKEAKCFVPKELVAVILAYLTLDAPAKLQDTPGLTTSQLTTIPTDIGLLNQMLDGMRYAPSTPTNVLSWSGSSCF